MVMKSSIWSSLCPRYVMQFSCAPWKSAMKRINPASIRVPFAQYSHAVEVPAGRMLFASGQLGVAPDDTVPEDAEAQAVLSRYVAGNAFASTLVIVSGFTRPEFKVEVEVTAVSPPDLL